MFVVLRKEALLPSMAEAPGGEIRTRDDSAEPNGVIGDDGKYNGMVVVVRTFRTQVCGFNPRKKTRGMAAPAMATRIVKAGVNQLLRAMSQRL